MNVGEPGDELTRVSARSSGHGVLSILLGLLAILTVGAQYELLLFIWSGHENAILQFIYIGLPLVAIVLAARAQILAREGLEMKGADGVFGAIGVVVSLLALLGCFLVLGVSCAASGRLIGL
jgi:hypothetical protein